MIPYDLDPSLHSAEPQPPSLDDGFSPPAHPAAPLDTDVDPADEQVDPALWAKSQF